MSGWRHHAAFPTAVRRGWRVGFIRAAHYRYVHHKARDPLTVAAESEYQRRRRDGYCSICGRRGRIARSLCAPCRDAFGPTLAPLADLPARSA